jgi:hypothetical protein
MAIEQFLHVAHGLFQAPQPVAHGPLQVKGPFPTAIKLEAKNLPPFGADS